MASSEIAGGVPIIGEKVEKYALGDPTEEGSSVTLQLTVTPVQAAQMFGRYVNNRKVQGKGLPEEFTLLWIAASKGQYFLMEENKKLRKRIEKLEKKVEDLVA